MNPAPLFLIILTLPLLLGGCGEKPINNLRVDDFKVGDMVSVQTHKEILLPSGEVIKITPESIYVEWTRENEYGFETDGIELPRDEVGKDTFLIPLEKKVLKVKEDAKPEEPVAENKPKLEGVNWDELDERGEFPNFIYFIKGSDTLYTGKTYELNRNGQKWIERNLKNGSMEGLEMFWHENGQKEIERNWKNGKLEGLEVRWYENGQKYREGNWKNGSMEGLFVYWHENGKKKLEENFKNSQWNGSLIEWHKNGQKLGEQNYREGKLVEGSAKYWNSKGEPVDSYKEAEAE